MLFKCVKLLRYIRLALFQLAEKETFDLSTDQWDGESYKGMDVLPLYPHQGYFEDVGWPLAAPLVHYHR